MGRALAGLVAAALVQSAIAGAAGGRPAGDPETFVHRPKKFTLCMPVGARVIERGNKVDVVIRSPSGYVLAGLRPAATEVALKPGPPLAAARRFAGRELGFSIDYPRRWIVARPSVHTVTFSGRQGTEAFYAVVSIQNVEPPLARDSGLAVTAVIPDLKSQWAAGATDVGYFGEGPITYENNGLRLRGHQFLVAYTEGGQRFKQWTVVVPRAAGTVVHVWSYAAPDSMFAVFQPVAEAMRKTWAIYPR